MTERDYHLHLSAFTQRFGDAQRTALDAPDLVVCVLTGRRYDRIMVKHADQSQDQVRYFIDKTTGDIYGPRRAEAPNLRQYFGNIARADRWDWSGWRGVAISDSTVRLATTYTINGVCIHHYVRVDTATG